MVGVFTCTIFLTLLLGLVRSSGVLSTDSELLLNKPLTRSRMIWREMSESSLSRKLMLLFLLKPRRSLKISQKTIEKENVRKINYLCSE